MVDLDKIRGMYRLPDNATCNNCTKAVSCLDKGSFGQSLDQDVCSNWKRKTTEETNRLQKDIKKLAELMDEVAVGNPQVARQIAKEIAKLRKVLKQVQSFLRAWQPDKPGPMARQFGKMIAEVDKALEPDSPA